MTDYQLKLPPVYNYYEKEYPVNLGLMVDPPALCIPRYSFKGTDGIRREDYKATEYVADCQRFGFRYAGFHFLRPNDITQQADLYLSVWDRLRGVRPMVDVEIDLDNDNPEQVGRAKWRDQVYDFLLRVQSVTGQVPVIYTSTHYWSFLNVDGVPPAWSKDFDCWAVFWPFKPDDFSWIPDSQVPNGFLKTRVALWQYTGDSGRSNGYPVNDLNIASDWFLAELGGQPTGGKMQITPKSTYGSKVRADHSTSAAQVGSLVYGATAEVLELWGTAGSDQWARIAEGWVAVWYQNTQYGVLSGELPPPPPPPTGEVKPSSMDLVLHYKDGTQQAVNGITLPDAT